MFLQVKSIRGTPGESLPFSFELDLTHLEFMGERPIVSPVTVSGDIFNRAGILIFKARAVVPIETACARCAVPLSFQKTVDIEQTLATELEDEENDEIILITGNRVDAGEIVEQAIIFEMDMIHLCDDNCRGLCPICGTDLNYQKCSCNSEENR